MTPEETARVRKALEDMKQCDGCKGEPRLGAACTHCGRFRRAADKRINKMNAEQFRAYVATERAAGRWSLK